MTSWRRMAGPECHAAAMSGRPVLLFGTPRYGFQNERQAIGCFETGKGWRELPALASFNPTHWMPLPEPPVSQSSSDLSCGSDQ